jgi:hypothetical protein
MRFACRNEEDWRLLPTRAHLTNFVEIGQARDKVLPLKLDHVLCPRRPSHVGSWYQEQPRHLAWPHQSIPRVIPSLDSQAIKIEAEIGDINRARLRFSYQGYSKTCPGVGRSCRSRRACRAHGGCAETRQTGLNAPRAKTFG